LPPDVTIEELRELFGGIGQVIPYLFFWFIFMNFGLGNCAEDACCLAENFDFVSTT
jgi:hypothetical protein